MLLISTIVNGQTTLKIGDKIPDFKFEKILKADSVLSTSVSELYKPGLLIINFWATWCVPCVRELPYLNEIQKNHLNKLKIVCISNEEETIVSKYLSQNNVKSLRFISNDKTMNKIFPHQTVPHNIWVNKDGIICAITNDDEISENNIQHFYDGNYKSINQKQERDDFSFNKPFSVPDSVFSYRSIITPFMESIGNGGETRRLDVNRYFGWNLFKVQLLWHAFMKKTMKDRDWNLVEIKTKDSTSFFLPKYTKDPNWHRKYGTSNFTKWLRANSFCYELSFKKVIDTTKFFLYMQQDLTRYFNVNGHVENRTKMCYVVSKVSKNKMPLKSAGGNKIPLNISGTVFQAQNQSIKQILERIDSFYPKADPFINETGISFNIDFFKDFGTKFLGLGLPIEGIIERFEEMGFKIEKKMRPYPCLILNDCD